MESVNRGNLLEERSHATTLGKRRHAATIEESHHHHHHHYHEKRIRMVSETLRKEDLPKNTFTSNRFWPIQKHNSNREQAGNRKWVYSSREFSNDEDTVVVVSYNILGVKNASNHQDLYLKTSPDSLKWDLRKKVIHEEVNHYNASILCFQEVDRFNDVNNLFKKDGFRGVYKARTGEAVDGCAIFWKESLFSLLHQEAIEFLSFGLRDNVAQFCILKMNHNPSESNMCTQSSTSSSTKSRSLLIGNIHVLYNPKRGDIKLGQVRLFLETAHKLSQEWGDIPVIIAGDFNSVPESAIYGFLASSELDIKSHDRRKVSGQVEGPSKCRSFRSQNDIVGTFGRSISRPLVYSWTAEELRLAAGVEGVTHLQHHLNLSSAYAGVPGGWRTRDNNGEPLATSYHSKFMGTVDYIWHSKDLVPVRVLETLPKDTLRKTGGLPTKKWGSDHLALVCELAFADDRDES